MAKKIVIVFLAVMTIFIGFQLWGFLYLGKPTELVKNEALKERPFEVKRLPGNPIIRHTMDKRLLEESRQYGYANINGPSLIRVPAWVQKPLGRYYLYFAHHKGEYIRLAYADRVGGPWKIYSPGTLHLNDSFFATEASRARKIRSILGLWRRLTPTEFWTLLHVGLAARKAVEIRKSRNTLGSDELRAHIASPDVIVDEERREIRMYYHGLLADGTQLSRVALSTDGIHFTARPGILTTPYLRVFTCRDSYYGMSMPGILYRSKDGLGGFEVRGKPLFGVNMRHAALLRRGSTLFVFWSRVGDAPERLLCSTIDMSAEDWNDWRASMPVDLLHSEMPWEGADLPVEPSIRGETTVRAHELRDPAIFEEKGRTYLLYSCAGENALAIAELMSKP